MFEAYYSQLNTPCLVVDEPMTRENIKRMQQVADANGCTLRPHIKTHKTPYFAKLQQQLGARGITSCKVSEAEVMADAGLRDIFIAYPLVGAEKLRRACALAQRVDRLILAVDTTWCWRYASRSIAAAGARARKWRTLRRWCSSWSHARI